MAVVKGAIIDMRDGLAKNAQTIPQLNAYPRSPAQVATPCVAIIGPELIEFDKAMLGGSHWLTFKAWACVANQDTETAQRDLDELCSPVGDRSLKLAIESDCQLGGACDDLRLEQIGSPTILEWAGTDVLAVELQIGVLL